MARYNDGSYYTRWTNAKLMAEARKYANLETFSKYFRGGPVTFNQQGESGQFIRNETMLYRETWLNPILDEIERRFVKDKKNG